MFTNENAKLKKLVEKEVETNTNRRKWSAKETWQADHSGELPVYIVDTIKSEGLEEDKVDIMVLALQPSNRVLTFLVPYDSDDVMGAKLLAFNGNLTGARNKYAKLKITIFLNDNDYCTQIDDIEFLEEGGDA